MTLSCPEPNGCLIGIQKAKAPTRLSSRPGRRNGCLYGHRHGCRRQGSDVEKKVSMARLLIQSTTKLVGDRIHTVSADLSLFSILKLKTK